MVIPMYVYEPAEDSYLLAEVLKERECRRFLDMGCGTGIQANQWAMRTRSYALI